MEAYVGGNQMFLPHVNLIQYNNRIVKQGSNYYRIKIARANNYNTVLDHFELSGDTIVPSANNNLATVLSLNDSVSSNDPRHPTFTLNESNTMIET